MSLSLQILPADSLKFRENSADSIVYHLPGHTPTRPFTATVTRALPSPRKGNAGTMKIFVNIRKSEEITGPDGISRIVPVITKLETSVPVGTDAQTGLFTCLEVIRGFTADLSNPDKDKDATLASLFMAGYLPE